MTKMSTGTFKKPGEGTAYMAYTIGKTITGQGSSNADSRERPAPFGDISSLKGNGV